MAQTPPRPAELLLDAQNARAGLRPIDAQAEEVLDGRQRELAHALRAAARVVGAAGLPSEYRRDAFRLAAERELGELGRAA